MKLRTRLLICFIATTAVMALGLYFFSPTLFLRGYLSLERQEVGHDLARATEAFTQFGADLHVKSVDWAEWDDTYRFMADHNRAYVQSNLVAAALPKMKVDAILYLDLSGRVVTWKTGARLPGVKPPKPLAILQKLRQVRATGGRAGSGAFGVIALDERPMFVSVRPILTSEGNGPARGQLIFARYFGQPELRKLQEQTRLNVVIENVTHSRLTAYNREWMAAATTNGGATVVPIDAEMVLGGALIKGMGGGSLFAAKVLEPREIYAQGVRSIRVQTMNVIAVALCFAIVMFLLMKKYAVARLESLARQVEKCQEQESEAGGRISLPGGDELSWLAAKIDAMLSTLADRSARIRENEAKLRTYSEELELLVEKRTRQIEHQAFHDALTDLPNRSLFLDRLAQAASRSQRTGRQFAVLFLDLDNFKVINDSQGHEAGDVLLHAIAERLTSFVRPGDTVARLGGDEFTVLVEELEAADEVIFVAEGLAEVLKAPIRLPQGEVFASGSIGIAFSNGNETPEVVLRNADTAMYHAKSAGKGCYAVFSQTMNDRVVEQLEIETGLRHALANDEFRVLYQPLLDLNSGTVCGVEALVRWQHPTAGLIAPGKFIPVAEETGLIVPIGMVVLETACLDMKRWHEEFATDPPLMLNVNLSGKQLQRHDIVDQVRLILERADYPPQYLKLEITESTLMADVNEVTQKLHDLKALGLKLAIDDFGTGYSSMSSLSNLPVDTVKIDRSFITPIADHEEAATIVSAIVMISRTMRFDVTAEGIETPDQVCKLQALGCDIGQGYLFAKPLAPAELEARLRQGEDSFVANAKPRQDELVETLLRELEGDVMPQAA